MATDRLNAKDYHVGDVIRVIARDYGLDVVCVILGEGRPKRDHDNFLHVWYRYMNLDNGELGEFAVNSAMWKHAELVT